MAPSFFKSDGTLTSHKKPQKIRMSGFGEKLLTNRKTNKQTNGEMDGGYFKGPSLCGSKLILP